MNGSAALGWLLAVAAVVVGFLSYGWPGLVLGLTVVVFGLLLQFSRALRVLRIAGSNPVGHIPSAVMLNARLKAGMKLPEVLVLTRSLGRKVSEDVATKSETWAWTDTGGDTVQLTLVDGRLRHWELQRSRCLESSD